MTDTIKHMWDEVAKAQADGTFSSPMPAMTAKADTNPLREALEKLRSYNVDIAAGRINYRPHDHIAVADAALASEPVAGTVEQWACLTCCGDKQITTHADGRGMDCPDCNGTGSQNTPDDPATTPQLTASAVAEWDRQFPSAPPALAGREDLTRAMELAHEYDAGTAKCVASGYQEFGREFQRDRKIISDALRAYASPISPQGRAPDPFSVGKEWCPDCKHDDGAHDPKCRFAATPVDRAAVIEACARIAEHGCLVPPDGGSPTDAEREMCESIAAAIRSLAKARETER